MSHYAALPKAVALAVPLALGAWTVQAADIIQTPEQVGLDVEEKRIGLAPRILEEVELGHQNFRQSSPKTPSPGRSASISVRIARSVARSASVT